MILARSSLTHPPAGVLLGVVQVLVVLGLAGGEVVEADPVLAVVGVGLDVVAQGEVLRPQDVVGPPAGISRTVLIWGGEAI